jgi:hypothetical protein
MAEGVVIKSGQTKLKLEYLVIAGGAGGGNSSSFAAGKGGGGGAGGYRAAVVGELSGGGATAQAPITVEFGNTYNVVIGAGGGASTNGVGSSFDAITTVGGGRGADSNGAFPGLPGGSGGGASQRNEAFTTTGGAGTAGEGFNGGPGVSFSVPGAGGGAGGAGGSGAVFGPGLASNITGSSVTRAVGGSGGLTTAVAGAANTGNGGDGRGNSGNAPGAGGGSGVVIIRLPQDAAIATTTGSPTVTTSGGFRIYQFNGSGTIRWD